MDYYQYLVEFMGTLVVVYALLLTDTNPAIMGIGYFAVYTVGGEHATGTFNPLGALAYYMIGRVTLREMAMNIGVQMFAIQAAVISYLPVTAFIGELQ